jgi:alpha-L-fucosidase
MTDSAQEFTSLRPTLEQLQVWQSWGYGMFIHFGLSTFLAEEHPSGDHPSSVYAPDQLDVDQWVRVAKDAGMTYAVLTTKHAAGHCLWPSKHTDYHVGSSGNPTDVVAEFVRACAKYDILPGLYYCSMDNHHKFGSKTPTDLGWDGAYFTTREYQDFQTAQLEELLTGYRRIAEVWIDIPQALPRGYRQELYTKIRGWQPEAIILMNQGLGHNGTQCDLAAWPTDALTIERNLPPKTHQPWFDLEGERIFVPAEVCDTIGQEWFWVEGDAPRSDEELLGMYLVSRSRGANLLLDVPPDRHGLIPSETVAALMRLRANIDRFRNV